MISLNELALAAEPNESTKALITTAQTSGQHLLSILNDILDLSKIEANKLELENIPFDLRDCFAQVVAIADASAQAKGLAIETTINISENWRSGDPTRIRQILLNLTSNAVKFSSQGSIQISASTDEDRAVFTVRDQGLGMSPDHLKRLYQPFTQADAATTRIYGGTGLGLSICRLLVDAMKGQLHVESEIGKGTTISFGLPLSRAKAPVETPQWAPADAAIKLRVLVAEDNPTNQLIIRKMLQGLGHEVTLVADGQAAISAFQEDGVFDVILMDVQMPKCDGLEATRSIRALSSGSDVLIPIIGLSANAMRGDADLGRAAGMTDYLVKPVPRRALQDALLRAVSPASRHAA
jgi:CheY-like chemotaxis protein